MKNYYRVMLGQKSSHAKECFKGNFIGADFGIAIDLGRDLTDDWREFNKKFIPIFLKNRPDKTKVSAGLACGALWTIAKGMQDGDLVLCPNGNGEYLVGELKGTYSHHEGQILPHRRTVIWHSVTIDRKQMSEALRNSTGSIGTVSNISKHQKEIEQLLGGSFASPVVSLDPTIEDPTVFALESHLEHFLVENWKHTEFGKNYDLYEEDGVVGKQFPADSGTIDILAISKDKKELLVIELKKGRTSDNVVGQLQRYMGYVTEELADENQKVRGIIIALEEHQGIKWALKVTQNIEFYRYQVNFKLIKGSAA